MPQLWQIFQSQSHQARAQELATIYLTLPNLIPNIPNLYPLPPPYFKIIGRKVRYFVTCSIPVARSVVSGVDSDGSSTQRAPPLKK